LSAEPRGQAVHTRQASVVVVSRPMWRIRVGRELPRYLLCAASAFGLAASARYAIAPPRAAMRTDTAVAPMVADRAAEGYAVLFVRRYLTWTAAEPQGSARALEAFAGAGMEAGAGLVPPAGGEQHVEWAEVVQARERGPREHVYTVAAQTDATGVLYVSVAVERAADGGLRLVDYPALVGAPSAAGAEPAQHLPEVAQSALTAVVTRALRNYLAGSADDLAADLTSTARVSFPGLPLSIESLERLVWTEAGRSVLAVVHAQDSRGAQYVLAYELDVERQQGRWEVSAVQTDPGS